MTSVDTPAPATQTIHGYHAHVYFDANTVELAREICSAAAERFSIRMGRVHERPVGPHPDWSCQLAFRPDRFPEVIPWLMLNRQGLVVLVHPITGNDLRDHRDYPMWMGRSRPLDLSVLSDRDRAVEYEF